MSPRTHARARFVVVARLSLIARATHGAVLLYAARELQRKGAALPPTRDEVDLRARRSAIESELAPLRAFAAQHDVRRDAVSELSASMTKRAADIDKRAAAAAAQRDADALARHNALAKV